MSEDIEVREFRAPLGDTGLNVYLRNKRPKGVAQFGPDRTLLFVHGATFPASVVFDMPIDGQSWMDYIAQRGFDVWLMDLTGYGLSDRQKEMNGPAEAGAPVTTTETAIAAVAAAVEADRHRIGGGRQRHGRHRLGVRVARPCQRAGQQRGAEQRQHGRASCGRGGAGEGSGLHGDGVGWHRTQS